MVDVYYNQRIQKRASCPPWARIQTHSLFVRRSHKSHDRPSCCPQEDGVGTGSELWQACTFSSRTSPSPVLLTVLPTQRAQHLGNTAVPVPQTSQALTWEEPPPFPESQALGDGNQGAWELLLLWWKEDGGSPGALLEPGAGTPRIQALLSASPCSPPSAPSLGGEVWDFLSTCPRGSHSILGHMPGSVFNFSSFVFICTVIPLLLPQDKAGSTGEKSLSALSQLHFQSLKYCLAHSQCFINVWLTEPGNKILE